MGYYFRSSEPSAILVHVLLLLSINTVNSQEAQFLKSPRPQTVFLRSVATFYCDAIATFAVVWRVNGLPGDHPTNDANGITPLTTIDPATHIHNSTLTIPATEINNITSIQCTAASPEVESDEVVLLIQGLLDPVSELRYEPHGNFLKILLWTPPFTLDITDVDHNITYRVCNNIMCVNTTDTSYIFEVECSPVMYHVSACNPVGCSENATVMFPQDTMGLELIEDPEFMYGRDGDPLVHIHMQNEGLCHRVYFVSLDYRFGDGLVGSMEIDPLMMPNITGTVHHLTLTQPHILENASYSGSIVSDGLMIGVNFLTFDVQDFTANYMYTSEQDGYGDITVTCVFARRTRALGCIVIFRNGSTTRNITIMRSDENNPTEASSVLYQLPDGEYEVIAYDLEFDGTSDTDCEPVKKIFTFPPTTIPPSSSSTLLPSNSPPIVVPPGSSSGDEVSVIIGAVTAVLVAAVLVAVQVPVVVLLKRNVQRKITKVHLTTVQLTTVERKKKQDSSNGDSPDDLSKLEAALPSRRLELQFVGGGYAEARDTSDVSSAPHPPSQPRVEYAYIQKPSLQANPNSMYADLGPASSSVFCVHDGVGKSQYAEIKPHHRQPDSACATEPGTEVAPPAPIPVPKVTVEALMDMLRELEPKWLVLGEAFGVPEHILDIIDTNDECRSTCMREMLKEYLQRGDATPTWRNVANALHWMGEASLAEKIGEKYGIEINEPGSVGLATPVPAMPEDDPPPPPPSRIRPDEDAPPIPPWLQVLSERETVINSDAVQTTETQHDSTEITEQTGTGRRRKLPLPVTNRDEMEQRFDPPDLSIPEGPSTFPGVYGKGVSYV